MCSVAELRWAGRWRERVSLRTKVIYSFRLGCDKGERYAHEGKLSVADVLPALK